MGHDVSERKSNFCCPFLILRFLFQPEWAENLNSVLDDNKMLTLPSGERLSLSNNIRIILEVDSLEHTTPATVSRCGMVWFSSDTITTAMALQQFLGELAVEDFMNENNISGVGMNQDVPAAQTHFVNTIKPLILSENERTSSLVVDALDFALKEKHVMEPSQERLLHTLRAILVQGILDAISYDENHPDFPMTGDHMEKFAKRWLLHSLIWSFCGSAPWDARRRFSELLVQTSGVILPSDGGGHSLFDYRVRIEDGEYELWSESVPRMEIESHRVPQTDVVITTTDTVRHSDVLGAWLGRRTPLILCGPPGSGVRIVPVFMLPSDRNMSIAKHPSTHQPHTLCFFVFALLF